MKKVLFPFLMVIVISAILLSTTVFAGQDSQQPPAAAQTADDSKLVTVDVSVFEKSGNGRMFTGIPGGNFRVYENNVPQTIVGFTNKDTPLQVCLVVEFSNLWQQYYSRTWFETLQAVFGFVQSLKKDDYLAVVAYDMKPEILSDFSLDRQDAMDALARLTTPGFSESNLFDALTEAARRMESIEGRKAIVVISSGWDTFSRVTFDEVRKNLANAGVPVYAVGIGRALMEMAEIYGYLNSMDITLAQERLKTFANETGGLSYFPRFEGEMPDIFKTINGVLRQQYTLTYRSNNQKFDGKFRKIRVELVDPNGKPLPIKVDGVPVKYELVYRKGYYAVP
jgi:Ca-activated chloride channel homolog